MPIIYKLISPLDNRIYYIGYTGNYAGAYFAWVPPLPVNGLRHWALLYTWPGGLTLNPAVYQLTMICLLHWELTIGLDSCLTVLLVDRVIGYWREGVDCEGLGVDLVVVKK